MPIYEFYCPDCHTIFGFLSKKVDTEKRPGCPRCKKRKLQKQVSAFAAVGGKKDAESADDPPIDESKMEQAMEALAGDAEKISEDDPRQAAELMRKFSNMTGIRLGKEMEEAMGRMEAGEAPEKIEAEMGELLGGEEPFIMPEQKAGDTGPAVRRRREPEKDPTLHEM